MNQQNSVFMPGLTARGPVYKADSPLGSYLSSYLSGLPAIPSTVKYAAMAAALYAGYSKMIPGGLITGAALAAGIYSLFPDSAVQGSGAPTAAQVAASTAGAGTIDQTALSSAIQDSVNAMTPSLSGFFAPSRYNRKLFRK